MYKHPPLIIGVIDEMSLRKKKANNTPLFFTIERFVYSLYAHNLG